MGDARWVGRRKRWRERKREKRREGRRKRLLQGQVASEARQNPSENELEKSDNSDEKDDATCLTPSDAQFERVVKQ